jgi:uncharacterized membrane protein YheB (UPF0754 family)
MATYTMNKQTYEFKELPLPITDEAYEEEERLKWLTEKGHNQEWKRTAQAILRRFEGRMDEAQKWYREHARITTSFEHCKTCGLRAEYDNYVRSAGARGITSIRIKGNSEWMTASDKCQCAKPVHESLIYCEKENRFMMWAYIDQETLLEVEQSAHDEEVKHLMDKGINELDAAKEVITASYWIEKGTGFSINGEAEIG